MVAARAGSDEAGPATEQVPPLAPPPGERQGPNGEMWRPNFDPFSEVSVLLAALAVGVTTGVAVVGFKLGVINIRSFSFTGCGARLTEQGLPMEQSAMQLLLVPALGGLLVGLFREGIGGFDRKPEEGPDSPRPLAKTAAAAVTLGSGGSLGPEGPSVELGQTVSTFITSKLPQKHGEVADQRKAAAKGEPLSALSVSDAPLFAAGSAAGVAAGFNAPLASIFFAIETGVLRPNAATDRSPNLTVAAVLLASITAAGMSAALLGDEPAFVIPVYTMGDGLLQLPLFAGLGAVCGGASVLLRRGMAFSRDAFEKVRSDAGLERFVKPAIGGLAVGVLALALRTQGVPETPGVCAPTGLENVNAILERPAPIPALVLLELALVKVLATSVSRGSGLVGGMYAPSLFIGAALGAAFGASVREMEQAINASTGTLPGLAALLPLTADANGFALAGMAAVLAGVCRVPLTAIVLLFEQTSDYELVAPLMAAVGMATWTTSLGDPTETISVFATDPESKRGDSGFTQTDDEEEPRPAGDPAAATPVQAESALRK